MARRRMIDPNIWQSEDFSKLTSLAKLVFIGMFSMADDEGRGRAKPVYLKSMLFPYEDGMRVADIEKALSEIGSNMSVTIYTHDGNEYYALMNWSKWQRVDKPQPSKIPEPTIITESVGNHSGAIPESVEPKGKEVKLKEDKEIYAKISFGEFGHVLMTQVERDKLLAKYPQTMVDDKIADMDSRIQAKEAKYLKYKDHYATIGNWCRKDTPPVESKPDYKIKPDTNKQTFREDATWDEILDTLDN